MSQMNPDGEWARELNSITERVIGCSYRVGAALGAGYLERVYENALVHELRRAGLKVAQQVSLKVWCDGIIVGTCIADIVVEDQVILEIKAVRSVDDAHRAQCLNYLTATRLPVCLLLNFSKRVQVNRVVGPNAPRFPPLHLSSSGPSVASSASSPTPMTWAEQAEWDEP